MLQIAPTLVLCLEGPSLYCRKFDTLALVLLGSPQASNTNYEIPFLRKQTASLHSLILDHERKVEELKSSAKAAAKGYKKSCEELSIQVLLLTLLLLLLLLKLLFFFRHC
jgi:hypothetical protein